MFKKAVQRGRSERRGEAYSVPYVEPLSEARTKLAGFFNILLGSDERHIGADRIIAPALHGNPGRFPYIPLAG
jgi:hypothetical protein